jgi:hypothetical protein
MTFLDKEKHPRAMENLVQFETAGKLKQVDSIKELAEKILILVPSAHVPNTYPCIINQSLFLSIDTRYRFAHALTPHHVFFLLPAIRVAFRGNALIVSPRGFLGIIQCTSGGTSGMPR